MAFTEFYTNLGSTTLTAGYTAGAGSITVASTTGDDANYPFPTSVPFRLSVYDASVNPAVFKVILKVTAITDGTHFAVTAEGHDANAASGNTCYGAQTAASLTALRTDASTPANFSVGALPNGMTATTQSQNDNSTKLSTTAYTDLAVANGIAGVNPAVAVLAASTASITGTYNNGASGVGAFFTVTATGTFSLDGVAINTIGQRVLLKDQSSAFQNGVYTATVIGASLVSPVFTRSLDYNTPSDINSTGAIPVQSGTVNTTTSWLLTSTITTVGTDALTYVKFSIAPTSIVTAASPGVGIAHFAGSTQAVTSSAVALGGADVSGVLPGANGGGLVLVEQHTASTSASLNFTTGITSNYTNYLFVFENVLPATDNVNLYFRVSTNGGSSYDSGNNYGWVTLGFVPGASGASGGGTNTAQSFARLLDGASNSSTGGIGGNLTLINPLSASIWKRFSATFGYWGSGSLQVGLTASGSYQSTTAVNAVQFFASTGNLASGTIYCYGIAKI